MDGADWKPASAAEVVDAADRHGVPASLLRFAAEGRADDMAAAIEKQAAEYVPSAPMALSGHRIIRDGRDAPMTNGELFREWLQEKTRSAW